MPIIRSLVEDAFVAFHALCLCLLFSIRGCVCISALRQLLLLLKSSYSISPPSPGCENNPVSEQQWVLFPQLLELYRGNATQLRFVSVKHASTAIPAGQLRPFVFMCVIIVVIVISVVTGIVSILILRLYFVVLYVSNLLCLFVVRDFFKASGSSRLLPPTLRT